MQLYIVWGMNLVVKKVKMDINFTWEERGTHIDLIQRILWVDSDENFPSENMNIAIDLNEK